MRPFSIQQRAVSSRLVDNPGAGESLAGGRTDALLDLHDCLAGIAVGEDRRWE